jgi:hypothetical protein
MTRATRARGRGAAAVAVLQAKDDNVPVVAAPHVTSPTKAVGKRKANDVEPGEASRRGEGEVDDAAAAAPEERDAKTQELDGLLAEMHDGGTTRPPYPRNLYFHPRTRFSPFLSSLLLRN